MKNSSILTTDNLNALITETMPFGKYQGYLIADLPEEYLLWFEKQTFPRGHLGELLQLALLLNIDGSKAILDPLRPKKADKKPVPNARLIFD